MEAIGRQLGSAAERLRLLERTRKQARRVQQIMDTVPEGVQALDPGHAYLMQDILSDKEARIPSFGENTPLSLPGSRSAP